MEPLPAGREASSGRCAPPYVRHRPERTLLYQIVAEYYRAFKAHLAAQGADCAGLVLFGYPLHPPGKPERERSEHFPAIAQPALFLQGTRDKLCELDRLRRALATFRKSGTIHTFRERFIAGMLGNGYEQDFAERCFSQIEGFGEYGFPESHAASFALLVYASAWLKKWHPGIPASSPAPF